MIKPSRPRSITSVTISLASVIIVALAAAALGGAFDGSTTPSVSARSTSSALPGLPAGTTVGNATQRVYLGDGRAFLDPPLADDQPTVNAGQAWQAYVDANLFPACSGPQLEIYFGRYSDSQAATLQTDGTYVSDYQNVPEWVVHCKDVSLRPFGPPQQSSYDATPTTPEASVLEVVEVIDPSSGKVLLGFTQSVS